MKPVSFLLAAFLCLTMGGCRIENILDTTRASTACTGSATNDPSGLESIPTEATTVSAEPTIVSTEPTAHTHEYTLEIHSATCSADGYIAHYCYCGDTYTSDWTDALPHSYVYEIIEPESYTCGFTRYTCTVCNYSYKDHYIWNDLDESTYFFDDAAFIGDSITQGLMNYCLSNGALGNASFLCVQSYSVNSAVTGALSLTYRGERMSVENAIAACGANKVFIMLGTNDLNLFGEESIDQAMRNWSVLISRIFSVNPGIDIYIQSATPIFTGGEVGNLTNKNMDRYNEQLQVFAGRNGCYFIDIASYMKDSTNGMAAQYCSDKYVHLSYAGIRLWVNILKAST